MTEAPQISYSPFDDLVNLLRADGLNEKADLLHHMIHEVFWTAGSELIGELGSELCKIEKSKDLEISDVTKNKIEECFDMVRKVWPDFPRS